jgi:hypothetical protein
VARLLVRHETGPRLRTWLLTALGLLVACGPIPGGALSGQVADVPEDWTAALGGDHALCEIESRPDEPHSIQLDCFLHEGSLYVQSHRWARSSWWPVESWASVWIEHPDVRVRIDDSLYELTAIQMTSGQERESVLAFRGYESIPPGIVLFRFESRSRRS